MEKEFGQHALLSVSRGPIQEYLGMTLDFSVAGQVTINMSDYVKTMLNDAPTLMDGKAATPAAAHLFKVNTDDPKVLTKEKQEMFVHLVMQGLILSQRGRPDIRTAISFLCSRLNCPDEDDYKKLTRLIRYLPHTLYLCLVLGKDTSDSIRWWIDASYAFTPTCVGVPGPQCPWAMDRYLVGLGSKSSSRGARLRVRWLGFTISCPKFCGRRSFWRSKE